MTDRLPLALRLRLAAKAVTPPLLWSAAKSLKDSRTKGSGLPGVSRASPGRLPDTAMSEWEYVPEGWARTAKGWDVDAIAAAYREKWPSFLAAVAGSGPLGVNHEVPAGVPVPRDERDAEHIVLAFAYVLALAARTRDRLSLLDWGGGPGHYAVLARALLPGVALDYHSRDLPALAELGRELLPDLAFHDDDGPLERRYDLVVASSSLHYAEDWRATLRGLAEASGDFLYLARVPVALTAPSFVLLQRAQGYGYDTEYLGWVLNRDELVAEARLELVREFVLPALLPVDGAPESPVEHRGFLFRRPQAPRS